MEEGVYQTILEQVEDGVYFVDLDRRITFWNPGAEHITGYSASEVAGHSCSEGILRHVTEGGYHLCTHGCPLAAVMGDGRIREANVYLHHKRGHRVPVVVKGSPIHDESGAIIGSVEVFRERPATEFAANRSIGVHAAYLDPLTELGNRRYVEAHLDTLRASGSPFGLLFIDVDHFKAINDEWGHAVGDAVLRMVGQSIAHGLDHGDWAIRWGGEEFLVVTRTDGVDRVLEIAERLRMLIEESWLAIDEQRVAVTVSIGATMLEPDQQWDDALERADRLMYASKAAGRNAVSGPAGTQPKATPPCLTVLPT